MVDPDPLREGPGRFAGYAARIGRLLAPLSRTTRYLAYTSDVGESFRPVVRPSVVKAAYGVSFGYVAVDVVMSGVREHKKHGNVAREVVKVATFQSIASLALPAFVIHTQVKVFANIFHRMRRFTRWGPTLAGFALIPLLPILLDPPVEHVLDTAFDKVWPEKRAD